MAGKELFIGIDLGGTKISTALVTREGEILARDHRQTLAQEGKKAVITRMVAAARQVMATKTADVAIAAIGVGAPGPMDIAAGILLEPPNLPDWENVPLKQIIEDSLGVKTFLENDANAAALAEHRYGAGQGTRNMIYITASTGIGGGLILNGELYGGTNGAAGEIGHMTLVPDGPLCGCGNRGHLEALASGPAMANAARELLANRVPTLIAELVHGDANAITAKTVQDAAEQGDYEAERIISRAMEYMGLGMATLVNIFNPDMIVIGGGLSNLGARMFDPLRRAVRRSAFFLPAQTVKIVPAKLGADVGVLGAAVVAITRSHRSAE